MKNNRLSLMQLLWSESWPQALIRQLLWALTSAGLLLAPMRSSILLPKLGMAAAAMLCVKWLRRGRCFRRDCITAGTVLGLLLLLFFRSRMDHCCCWSVVLILLLAMEESRTVFLHNKSRFSLFVLLAEAAAGILFLCTGWRGIYRQLASWYALALFGVLLISCGRTLIHRRK